MTRTRRTHGHHAARVARWLILCATGALACSDGASAPEVETPAMSPPPFIVSNPQASSASFPSSDALASTTGAEVAYVALPPGAIPNADQVIIRARSSGATITAIAIDGGLDPVPVAAQPGDTLDLDVHLTSGSSVQFSVVAPGAARPVVVRTSPPPRKRDVPLNMTVIIVFSEPIQATSVNTSSVQLRTGSALVSGALSFTDSTHLTVSFTPGGPLAAESDYTLSISQAIRDLDGESMASPVSVPFRTVQAGASPSVIFTSVTAGQNHSCGLTNDGVAYCWGSNQYGILGDGTQTSSTTPVRVAGEHRFVALSAGAGQTCGLAADGDAYCWGVDYGHLGNEAREDQVSPTLVGGGIKFASITVGMSHTCGVSVTGAAYCWGSGWYGELGTSTSSASTTAECAAGQVSICPRPALVAGNLTFATLSAGPWVTCGVTTAGRAYCWGSNFGGELGIAPMDAPDRCQPIEVDWDPRVTPCSFVPAPVAGSLTFRSGRDQLAWGCGLTLDGAAYCWGRDTFYRLGAGPAHDPRQCTYPVAGGTITVDCFGGPIPVRGAHTFKAVYTNEMFSCGILLTGAAYCWGDNAGGELGTGPLGPEMCTGSGPCSTVPVPVAGGLRFASLAIGRGSRHACGVTVTGEAYCWGSNESGELGNGTTKGSPLPVRVSRLP